MHVAVVAVVPLDLGVVFGASCGSRINGGGGARCRCSGLGNGESDDCGARQDGEDVPASTVTGALVSRADAAEALLIQ